METHYTPTIEEIHVGFEYEFQGVDCNWTPTGWEKVIQTQKGNSYGTFGNTWLSNFKNIESSCFRVKYLDREDIESLGFKCMGGNWYHDHKAYQIIGDWKSIEISKGEHEYRDVLFKGTIKNKSELKRLLKQLKI